MEFLENIAYCIYIMCDHFIADQLAKEFSIYINLSIWKKILHIWPQIHVYANGLHKCHVWSLYCIWYCNITQAWRNINERLKGSIVINSTQITSTSPTCQLSPSRKIETNINLCRKKQQYGGRIIMCTRSTTCKQLMENLNHVLQ
jgi:hypothetical protein